MKISRLTGLLMLLLILSAPLARAAYPYQSCFEVAASMHDLPVELLLAVAATESNWDPDARSHSNAHGIMQIQWPGTARHLGVRRVAELYNPCLNIELGARYLAELLQLTNGNLDRALASYNYGPGRIAGSPQLPSGAQRYVTRVGDHRQAIVATLARDADPNLKPGSAHELVRFSSRQRARRYASELASRTDGLRFDTVDQDDGSCSVTMRVPSTGISSADQAMLHTLGLRS